MVQREKNICPLLLLSEYIVAIHFSTITPHQWIPIDQTWSVINEEIGHSWAGWLEGIRSVAIHWKYYIYIYKKFIRGRHDTPWMHGVHNPGSDHGSALTVYTWPVTGHAGTSVAEPPAFGPENRSLAWQSGKQKNSDSTCWANYPLVFFTQHGKSHICRWFHLFEYHQFPWLC